jgi:winged helix DNA-binding protein
MPPPVLSDRALNRATLARQLLLERRPGMTPLEAVAHLVGLQAQVPHDPYTALWSRLDGFRPDELSQLLADRDVVRIPAMRATIHLLTADDCLALRPVVQPVLDRELASRRDLAPALDGVDLGPVLAFAHERLTATPLSTRKLREALAEAFPDHDATALAYACRCRLPLVQVPPRGLWGRGAAVTLTPADTWLGRPLAEPGGDRATTGIDAMVLRYLAAFGPASTADVSTWCRLTGMREVTDRLRPQLVTFRDERGRELLDLPDAPRPDPDTPAPTRFLPEYDNLLLSHDDRRRVVDRAWAAPLYDQDRLGWGSVLHDGRVVATWRHRRDQATGDVDFTIKHRGPLAAAVRTGIAAEAEQLVEFLSPPGDGIGTTFTLGRVIDVNSDADGDG